MQTTTDIVIDKGGSSIGFQLRTTLKQGFKVTESINTELV